MWIYGSFRCERYGDPTIFDPGLESILPNRETVLDDGGYRDEFAVGPDAFPGGQKTFCARCRERDQRTNRRVKHSLPLVAAFHFIFYFNPYVFRLFNNA